MQRPDDGRSPRYKGFKESGLGRGGRGEGILEARLKKRAVGIVWNPESYRKLQQGENVGPGEGREWDLDVRRQIWGEKTYTVETLSRGFTEPSLEARRTEDGTRV